MFAGCLSAALWANNVKLRLPRHRIRIVQALAGGIIAGFGARLAMGCNLAAFFTFTCIPQFSLYTWFFSLAMAAGSYFRVRFTLLPMLRLPVKLQKIDQVLLLQQDANQAHRRFRLGMLIERAQICFTSAFRDL